MNSVPYTVVGVAAAGFRGAKPGLRSDVFVPVTMKREVWGGGEPGRIAGTPVLNVVGRLRRGRGRRARPSARPTW